MRRREKFVISAILLTLGLLGVQYVPLDIRYVAVVVLVVISYLVSAWALADDLQKLEWLTIIPFPAFYTAGVALFYFLLPANLISKVALLGLFGVGMYALYLTSNIYSVAKGRTIQLLHAAHAIGLLFTLLTALLLTNTLYSLRLPFYINGVGVALIFWPLITMFLWSVNLEMRISRQVWSLASVLTLLLVEVGIILSWYPFSVWHNALFLMTLLYVGLGILHNFLRGRLFSNTLTEYSLVAILMAILFVGLFPGK